MVELDTSTRIVILQHPRESEVPIGTARLAEIVFTNAERHVGVEFSEQLFASATAPPILLFPGDDVRDLARDPPTGPVTLVVIDGTWSQAKKILKQNPRLRALPRYALDPPEPSRYRIRKAPAPHCISTIEAIVAAVEVLERRDVHPALTPFDNLVEHQLRFARSVGEKRQLRNKPGPRRPRAAQRLAERAGDLVVAYGEANAWPRGTPLGSTPELVHWAAERLESGERFEAVIRPETPLSPSFRDHTGIPDAFVLGGESRQAFLARWHAFTRPTDLLCCWGYFASELLRKSGALLPEHLDMRVLARQHLRRKTGDVLDCVRALGAQPSPAWIRGRTGLRLAGVTAVTHALLSDAG
jgi:DTW domain-containing protein YfiP